MLSDMWDDVRMRRMLFVALVVAIVAATMGCVRPSNTLARDARNVSVIEPVVGITDYGHGVYYFDRTQADFGNALSGFIATHACIVQAIAGDDSNAYGFTSGYFVVCR